MTTHHRRTTRLGTALLTVGAVSALVVGGLATPAQAALAAPTGVSLFDPDRTNPDDPPILQWTRVSGASSYKVEVEDTATGTVLVSATTVNHRYVPTRRVAGTASLEWRVQAVAGSSRSAWSGVRLASPANPRPNPVSPADGATLAQPAQPPVLEWTGVSGAESYQVEVSRDGFVTSDSYDTEATALVVPDPVANGTYQWRVTADLGSRLLSPVSAARSFTIGRLGEAVTRLIEDPDDPDNDPALPARQQVSTDEVVEDVVLDWDPVPGAVTYELWVSSDPDFNDTQATVEKIDDLTGTRFSPSETYANDSYYWKVRAVNAQDETVEWPDVTRRTFRRDWPDKASLLLPADGDLGVRDPLSFQWTPIQHASRYELNVGTDPNFSPGTFAKCFTASTTFTPTGGVCTPAPLHLTYWRVRGVDAPADVPGLWSPTGSFSYAPDGVAIEAPAPGATVAVPTLRWDSTTNAERYVVTILDSKNKTQTITTHALSATPNLAKGTYRWRVQYKDHDGTISPEPALRAFTVDGDLPSSGQPALTPLTGTAEESATVRFPALSWEPLAGADHYEITMRFHGAPAWLSPTYDGFLTQEFDYPAATDTGTSFLVPGSYDWHVTAYDGSDEIATGPDATFRIAPLDQVTGHRLALSAAALDADHACTAYLESAEGADICTDVPSTPVLEWDSVQDASFYLVYLSRDRELTNLVYPITKTPVTSNTRWTPSLSNSPAALPDSQAGTPYHWVIRPCVVAAVCAPDPTSQSDSAEHAFDKRSPAPGALDATSENDLTFTWQDYLATNLATTYQAAGGSGGEASYQSAQEYRIEVATTRSFAGNDVIDRRVVDQPTYTPYSTTYPEGPLYWRVQAIDEDDNGLTWSATASVTKRSPEPTLAGPTGGAHVQGTAALRWDATPYAGDYTVQVLANDDDETASPANEVFEVNTEQTAYAWDELIPASDHAYVWRVRRNDAKGKPGSWSAWGRFLSDGAAPTQAEPAAGTFVPAKDALFRWSAVGGASKYRFDLRPLNGSIDDRQTAYPAWAPTSALRDGVYDWRVVALDASGGVFGTSGWWRFTVDATAPKLAAGTPAKTAKPGSSFKATFTEKVTGVSATTFTLTRVGTKRALPAVVRLSANGKVATLNPKANLQRGRAYTVRLGAKVRDVAGNPLAVTTWRVTVG